MDQHAECKAIIRAVWSAAINHLNDIDTRDIAHDVFRFATESIELRRGCPLHPEYEEQLFQ